MDDNVIFCEHCGARCSTVDIFCKSCFTKLISDTSPEEQIIEGIDNNDLSVFLGKNESYYMNKFAGKNGKKHYFQLNWSALAFGQNWFLYRGMHKVVIFYYFFSVALGFLLASLINLMYSMDVASLQSATDAITDYLLSGGKRYEGYHMVREYKFLLYERDLARYNFFLCCIPIFLVSIIVDILFRLSANSIYRQHVIRNIGHKEGGASIATLIGGIFVLNLVENLSIYLIILITGLNLIFLS